MHWNHPTWLWAQLLSLLVLSALSLSHVLQLYRMKRFGDRHILRVPSRMAWHMVRAALLALGTTCIAAILAGPHEITDKSSSTVPVIHLVFDYRPGAENGGEAERPWEEFCDNVELLVASSPTARFSASEPGNPLAMLVAGTADVEGLLLLLNSLQPQHSNGSSNILRRGLDGLLRGRPDNERNHVVLISSRTREELLLLRPFVSQTASRPLIIRLLREKSAAEFGVPAEGNRYIWSDKPEILGGTLAAQGNSDARVRPLWKRFTPTRLFALVGFLLLFAEFAGPLILRTRGGKDGQ